MKNVSHRRGFTLIELMIVTSIISLLSSVVLASVKLARAKVEDAVISNDVRSYIIALDLYQLDHAGNYPLDPDGNLHCLGNKNPGGVCTIDGVSRTQSAVLNAALSSYIPSLPSMIYRKTYNNSDLTGYGYSSGGSNYNLYYVVGASKSCYGLTLTADGINKYCYATALNNGASSTPACIPVGSDPNNNGCNSSSSGSGSGFNGGGSSSSGGS